MAEPRRIHYVKQTPLGIDCQAEWIHQTFVDLSRNFVIRIEHKNLGQLPIRDEHPVVVVHGNGVDHGAKCASKPLRINSVSLVSVLNTNTAPTF